MKELEVIYVTRTGSVNKKIPKSAWESPLHGANIKREGYRLSTMEELKKDPTVKLEEIKKEIKTKKSEKSDK